MKQYGVSIPLSCALALLISGFVLTSGCSALFTEEGPLPRYLSPSPTKSLNETPAIPAHNDSSQVPLTIAACIIQEVTVTQNVSALTAPGTNTYHPLEVTILPDNVPEYRTYKFRYRTDDYEISLPVNRSLYLAANKSANKGSIIDAKDLESFYRQMLTDPALDPFYDNISQELNGMRYNGGRPFTDDEYLEFLVSFVQQIPTDGTVRTPRYPVEVVYNQKGTSDEKAILLAKLLAHEGYDTGLLIFRDRQQAIAGIRIHLATSNPSYRVFSDGMRDYMYIESSTNRLIGIYPDEYETAPGPAIIPVGSGTITYTKINSVLSIIYDLKTLKKKIDLLKQDSAKKDGVLKHEADNALKSYVDTYNFVMSTNDRLAAREAIRESALPHYSACMSCD